MQKKIAYWINDPYNCYLDGNTCSTYGIESEQNDFKIFFYWKKYSFFTSMENEFL